MHLHTVRNKAGWSWVCLCIKINVLHWAQINCVMVVSKWAGTVSSASESPRSGEQFCGFRHLKWKLISTRARVYMRRDRITFGCTRYVSTQSIFMGTASTMKLYPCDRTTSKVCKGTLMYGTSSAKMKFTNEICARYDPSTVCQRMFTWLRSLEVGHDAA